MTCSNEVCRCNAYGNFGVLRSGVWRINARQRIVEAHGATLDIDGMPGGGRTITVTLPKLSTTVRPALAAVGAA
jgi:hypothetical protein